jgi:hypothetical protein
MPNHHPSRSWRGCAMCKPHKRRGTGRPAKDPVAVKRRIGYARRYGRHTVGATDPSRLSPLTTSNTSL